MSGNKIFVALKRVIGLIQAASAEFFKVLSLEPTLLPELKMRGKRSKQYRKLMQQYGMVFGFREPYQVLGTFDRVALSDTLLLIALCTVDAQTIQDTEHFKMDLLSGAFIPAIINIHVLEANRFLFLRLGAYTQRCVLILMS